MKCKARSIVGYHGDTVQPCDLEEKHTGDHKTGGEFSFSFNYDEADAALERYTYLNNRPVN